MAIEKISAGVKDYTTDVSTQANADARSKEAASAEKESRVASISEAIPKEAGEGEGVIGQVMNHEILKKRISEINRQLNKSTECHYGIHEETQRVTLKIVDKETQEVIKEFPAEKTLEMIAKVWELAGILVDERR